MYLSKQRGRTNYLLRNKAKTSRKVTEAKKYPILEAAKRPKSDAALLKSVLNSINKQHD